MPARPVGGSDILTNCSPASETATGETWDDKTVYAYYHSGVVGANGSFLLSGSYDQIVRQFGWVESTSGNYELPWPVNDRAEEAILTIRQIADADQYKMQWNVAAGYVGQNCGIVVHYTKN